MPNLTNEFDGVFFRLRELNIKNQRQLAIALGITAAPITAAKQRGHFPKGWAVTLAKKYGKSVDWILGMEHPPMIHSENQTFENQKDEIIKLQRMVINNYDKTMKDMAVKIDLLRGELLAAKGRGRTKAG